MNGRNSVIRVAQVVRPAEGGIRKHVSLLTAGLDREHFSPSIYAPADFTLDAAAQPIKQHIVAISAKTNISEDLRAINDLTKQLRGNADLVHAHGLRAALIGVLAAKRAGVPSLFTAHNLVPPTGRLQRVLLRIIGQSTRRILAVSQAVADSLITAGFPNEKICVVPNGISVAAFDLPDTTAVRSEWNIPAHAPLVVGLGRLSPEKGFDLLITAFADVLSAFPTARLLIAGDGPERESLHTLAVKLDGACHFPGRVENPVSLLKTASIVAVPSRQEGQGIVALEAMAAHKPVVATNVGGLAETIAPDITGMLVPPEKPDELAKALILLLKDSRRCHEMGIQGRLRVEQHYTLERMIYNIETIYKTILEN